MKKKELKREVNANDPNVVHILYVRMAECAYELENDKSCFTYAKKALELQPDCQAAIIKFVLSGVISWENDLSSSYLEETEKVCLAVVKRGEKKLISDPCKNKPAPVQARRVINDCRYVLGLAAWERWRKREDDDDKWNEGNDKDLKDAKKHFTKYVKEYKKGNHFLHSRAKEILENVKWELKEFAYENGEFVE